MRLGPGVLPYTRAPLANLNRPLDDKAVVTDLTWPDGQVVHDYLI